MFKFLYPELDPDNVCIIFLGDFGINLGGRSYANDQILKDVVSQYGYHLLICRGNHEQRSSQVPNMERVYDEELQGYVWQEEEFPLIKFFDDVPGEYNINGYSVLVIPGGHSVDQAFRVATGRYWNPEEMLTQEEMNAFKPSKKHYDFIFSHILPLRFLPYDLFLSFIDQSKVDYSFWIAGLCLNHHRALPLSNINHFWRGVVACLKEALTPIDANLTRSSLGTITANIIRFAFIYFYYWS
jgi:hypothetical protein